LSDDAAHFVVFSVADDDDAVAVFFGAGGEGVDLVNHGTGGVDDAVAVASRPREGRTARAVGTDEKRRGAGGSETFDLFDSGLRDGSDDVFVVDDVPEHLDVGARTGRFEGEGDGSLHAEAKTGGFGELDLHGE
jgi:hypothetical protein